jgi:hypothetical protein
MTAMTLDPRHHSRFPFDAGAMKSGAPANPMPTRRNPSSVRLACRWQRTDGHLGCTCPPLE